MNVRKGTISVVAALALNLFAANMQAASILILTGNGTSSLDTPLSAAGFTVVNGTLAPGQLAANISGSTVAVYIWNDGSLGNTGSPANPALDFNAADQAALTTFRANHSHVIMDGLSWRSNANSDEIGLDQNEALALAGAGGGIVLGADDASGALIVQHVNQVAGWFNFNLFTGVYYTPPADEIIGGSFFTSPNTVNPTNVVGTTSYSEVPNGLQPNGDFLSTAVFGSPSIPYPGYGSPALGPDTFNGVTYAGVNHLVTTDIAGGGIPGTPEPGTLAIAASGFALLALVKRRRSR